jgi:hypothetical protein
MKAVLEIANGSYGFGMNWTLTLVTPKFRRSFYLGQDVKFCNRVLGVTPREIVNEIGSGDIGKEKVRNKLARYIVKRLELTASKVEKLQPWELCAE